MSFFKPSKNPPSSNGSGNDNDIVGSNIEFGNKLFYVEKVIAEGKVLLWLNFLIDNKLMKISINCSKLPCIYSKFCLFAF